MAILIHPHARERMEERGAAEDEVGFTLRKGFLLPARFGRRKHWATFPFERYWNGKFFRFHQIEAYSVDEGEDIIVITVVVKYF